MGHICELFEKSKVEIYELVRVYRHYGQQNKG